MNQDAARANAEDVTLLRQAKEGSRTACEQLVIQYQDRIYNVVYRMCRHREDALDLTQNAFMKALQALPRFQEEASFFTWIYRIAINEVLSHRRQRVRRPMRTLHTEDGARPRLVPAETAEEHTDKRIDRHALQGRLEAALAELDDDFRVAVVLKDIEDFDYATIADMLEIPVGTVKSRIHRGRMVLREKLRDSESEREPRSA